METPVRIALPDQPWWADQPEMPVAGRSAVDHEGAASNMPGARPAPADEAECDYRSACRKNCLQAANWLAIGRFG